MKRDCYIPMLLLVIIIPMQPLPIITSPMPGDVLHGEISILGTSTVTDFESADLEFSYSETDFDTWFLISSSASPVENGILGIWDTTTITEGDYQIRLRVHKLDGTYQDVEVKGLQIRNNSLTEDTDIQDSPPEVFNTPGDPLFSQFSPTSLPDNPARLEMKQVFSGMVKGASAILIIIILGFIYSHAKKP